MSTHLFISICGILSVVLTLFAVVPYIQSILAGRTKPHQFSWLIFVIMNGITLASQLVSGARASALLFGAFFFAELAVFLLSFKYGVRSTSRFDKLLLGLSLGTIVVWGLTRNTAIAVWLTAIIDIPATAMTVLKARSHPGSEAPWPWFLGTIACVFSCLTLIQTPFGILYVRPYYAVLSELVVFAAALMYPGRKSTTPTDMPKV